MKSTLKIASALFGLCYIILTASCSAEFPSTSNTNREECDKCRSFALYESYTEIDSLKTMLAQVKTPEEERKLIRQIASYTQTGDYVQEEGELSARRITLGIHQMLNKSDSTASFSLRTEIQDREASTDKIDWDIQFEHTFLDFENYYMLMRE